MSAPVHAHRAHHLWSQCELPHRIDDVTCTECLDALVRLGDAAAARIVELERAAADAPSPALPVPRDVASALS